MAYKALMELEEFERQEREREKVLMWDETPPSRPGILESGAVFSECRIWRYTLTRIFNPTTPPIMFIGLNPSTADEVKNDPTVRRCIGFAYDWGAGGLIMTNAFGYRSTDPRGLTKIHDPVGPLNDAYLRKCFALAARVVVAWGNWGNLYDRDRRVLELLQEAGVKAKCFGLTKTGQPRHPLYLRRDEALVDYRGRK